MSIWWMHLNVMDGLKFVKLIFSKLISKYIVHTSIKTLKHLRFLTN